MRGWFLASICVCACVVGCGDAPEPPQEGASAPSELGHRSVASFDGVPIAYTVSGPDVGAVVMIHGWACDRGYWREQLPLLAERYRVVAIDLAGHGDSGSGREVWTLESLARDVEAVVEDLRLEAFVLVGHSMGGDVGLHVAARMPERSIGLVGVDTLQDFEFALSLTEERWHEFLAPFESDFRSGCEDFVRGFFLETSPPDLEAEIVADMCSTAPEPAVALLRDYRNVNYADLTSRARVPIRCINATQYPTEIETNRRYADFDATIMEDVGHFPMLEAPEAFNELLLRTIEELTSARSVRLAASPSVRAR